MAVRWRYAVIVLWVVVTILSIKIFPSLANVSNSDSGSFLPSSSPSVHATTLASPFAAKGLGTATLVAYRLNSALTPDDLAAVRDAENAIRVVQHVVGVRDQGISGDGTASKVQVSLDILTSSSDAKTVVGDIRSAVARTAKPAGLTVDLAGSFAINVDNQSASRQAQRLTQLFSNLIILVMLFVVYRALLAPLLTLIPAVLSLLLAGPVIAEASTAGVKVSSVTQVILTVLVLGAGTDYGLFLTLRMREELRRGLSVHDAVVEAVARVGESITFSAATVIVALLCLVFATFGVYQGLGPGLAIGIAVTLLSALTLLPALLAIFGRAAFWPTNVAPGEVSYGAWGRIAGQIVAKPLTTLIVGLAFFGGLAIFALGYVPSGFAGTVSGPDGSESANGTNIITARFPSAVANPTAIIMTFPTSAWDDLTIVQRAEQGLSDARVFQSVNGLLNPNGTSIQPAQLESIYAKLGPPQSLPVVQSATSPVPASIYNLYRTASQFISADGKTVQFYTTLAAGDGGSTSALQAVPSIRTAVASVAQSVGATDSGMLGRASVGYDVSSTSDADLRHIVPLVLILIAVLLAIVMRSLVAPLYLVASVALSFATSLGLAVLIFVRIGGAGGLDFVLPFLMFIFLMALGEDYNILVMSRIREEAQTHSLPEAIRIALNATGTTVTSAGVILAATFFVSGVAGNSAQIRQLGIGIGVGILLDTFLVRTLLVPSVVALLGRWNWWPSALSRRQPE